MRFASPLFTTLMTLTALTSIAGSQYVHAAACCGAGSAAPTIISGDDAFQFSTSVSFADVIGDARANGVSVFRATGDDETTQTIRLDGALLISDRWQLGASAPIIRRSRSRLQSSDSATGLGDLTFNTAYEVLPEWGYSVWKPRGFLFGQVTIPTGGSIYDLAVATDDPWGLDSRGRGFFNIGMGALFTKTWGSWDAFTLMEAHRSFQRTFHGVQVNPGFGGSVAIAGGYSPTFLPLRVGLALSPAYEGAYTVTENGQSSTSSHQLVWNTSLQLGWLIHSSATLSAIYTDQTLTGPATNVSLSRTLAVTFQKRWER
jgi:hypothetical protein